MVRGGGFNSKLVRLKETGDVDDVEGSVKFQFQTGSIKRLEGLQDGTNK